MKNQTSNLLVIDREEDNIQYQRTTVNNTVDYKPELDELTAIYKEDHESIIHTDTSNCILLILEDNTEIPLCRYNYSQHPKFLKILSPVLKDKNQEILISCDNNHNESLIRLNWRFSGIKLSDEKCCFDKWTKAITDFNGYGNTMRFIEVMSRKNPSFEQLWKGHTTIYPEFNSGKPFNIPIIDYCHGQKICLNNVQYQGYLPAMGELRVLFQNLSMINYIFKYIGVKKLSFNTKYWISSTEGATANNQYYSVYQWCYSLGSIVSMDKGREGLNVLPLFKKLQ